MKTYGYPTAFSCWGDEERIAIERVLDSGRFTMGPEVAAFEREFADYHGKAHGVMVNSGSSANLIAVAALFHVKPNPLRRGQKALVPAIAWSTTYAPLVQYGLELILVDVDNSWNADVGSRRFNPPEDVRLVVGCSILGTPADLTAMKTAAGVLDAYFVEDNCESLGAEIDGKLCGTFGDMSTFSFFFSHQISAIEGGMILTDDDELADLCRMLRAHGWTRDVGPPMAFEGEYDFRLFGYNVRPLELHAAIAREQLRKLGTFIEARRANAALFCRLTEGLPVRHPEVRGEPSPFGLHFEVESRQARNRLVEALRLADIDCRLPTGGSFRLHAYGAAWASQESPRADEVHRNGLFLGNAPFSLDSEVRAAVEVMKGVL